VALVVEALAVGNEAVSHSSSWGWQRVPPTSLDLDAIIDEHRLMPQIATITLADFIQKLRENPEWTFDDTRLYWMHVSIWSEADAPTVKKSLAGSPDARVDRQVRHLMGAFQRLLDIPAYEEGFAGAFAPFLEVALAESL
jgi:hypothetical protein